MQAAYNDSASIQPMRMAETHRQAVEDDGFALLRLSTALRHLTSARAWAGMKIEASIRLWFESLSCWVMAS